MPRATFSTTLGTCAIAWDDTYSLTSFNLPEAARRADDVAAAPPPEITAIIERVRRHLTGDLQDFSDLPYDFSAVPAFNQRVLRATLAIKAGHTATYGQIATAIDAPPAASRGVGATLGANRWPLLIPCHRVTGADGKMTGFSGPGGIETKAQLLALEGARLL
jgi:methylated-DNA-[protein]-cysteine S-methyltransferase